MRVINETGNRYGKLFVVSKTESKHGRHIRWSCLCDCGKKTVVSGHHLRGNNTKSCGCVKDTINELGNKYGSLAVVKQAVFNKGRAAQWVCRCDCGKEVVVAGTDLRACHNTSCGCGIARNKKNTRHGMSKTREYRSWVGMKKRCYDSESNRYEDYGGRGITVSLEWLDSDDGVINFINYVGKCPSKKHSLDRIDVDGNYEPGNVRWATAKEQSNNRRKYCVLEKFTTKELLRELKHRDINVF